MSEDEDALSTILHNEGAYCGDRDYESGFKGRVGCKDCARVLAGYAKAILSSGWLAEREGEVAERVWAECASRSGYRARTDPTTNPYTRPTPEEKKQ